MVFARSCRFSRSRPPNVPFDDNFFDAAMLFAVLTCIPADDDQRAVVNELHRVVGPGGLLYVSDYWLQADQRNRDRYAKYRGQHRTCGVFEMSEGVAVRHHSREWIAELLRQWEPIAAADIQVTTMNGHEAAGVSVAWAKNMSLTQCFRSTGRYLACNTLWFEVLGRHDAKTKQS